LLGRNNSVDFAPDEYAALKGVDALLIATEWPVFRTPDFSKMDSLMKAKVIFDGRNLYDLDDMRANGFYYNSVGRETVGG
jgi:UDPglucose 6-dehydrogenase